MPTAAKDLELRAGAALLAAALFVSLSCEEGSALDPIGRQGALNVTTRTTGSNLDPNGYLLTVAGPPFESTPSIGINDTVTYPSIEVAEYDVSLSGVASNCQVPQNPRTVRIEPGVTTSVLFEVTCQ